MKRAYLAIERANSPNDPLGVAAPMAVPDPLFVLRLASVFVAIVCLAATRRASGAHSLRIGFALFSASSLLFTLQHLAAGGPPLFVSLFAILGGAGCGWFWVYSRTLFRPTNERIPPWAFALVAAIMAVAALHQAAAPSQVLRVIGNYEVMLSSTLMALGLVEPLRGLKAVGPRERRFRIAFISAFGAMISASVIWLRHAADGSAAAVAGDAVRAACVLAALTIGFAAFRYRLANPVRAEAPARRQRRENAGPAAPEDAALAARIERLLEEDEIFRIPTIKVADLAEMLGEPDYKVSRCITGAMGFANFNRLMNRHRVACAEGLLSDPDNDNTPILSIALECGFGSVGPFNRAFKQATGRTPREFRAGRHNTVPAPTRAAFSTAAG